MNHRHVRLLPILGVALLFSIQPVRGFAMTDAIAKTVNTAFAAAREGNYEGVSSLNEQGPAILPYLQPYLRDANEMVRLQAVALLGTFTDARAAPLLLLALTDPLQDIRARAALALYEKQDPAQLAGRPEVGQALRASLDLGNDAAAAILLLSYFPGESTRAALNDLRGRSADAQTELYSWTSVTPVGLVIAVSLSRLGSREARIALLQTTTTGTLAELEFLLSVLREIDAPELLHALAKTLDDTRNIGGGAPSGVESPRRLCDLAVVSFINRLNLKVGFAPDDIRQFTPAEIDRVRHAIADALPQG